MEGIVSLAIFAALVAWLWMRQKKESERSPEPKPRYHDDRTPQNPYGP